MAKKLNKKELVALLVDTYGYEADDIKMLTNAKLEGLVKQEEADAKELEAKEEMDTVFVARQTFKDDDLILVMNGLNGGLTHNSRSTGRIWQFRTFGQTEKLPYSELLSIRNLNPKVFNEGWMLIMNKQIQEDFGLVEVYKNILTPESIDKVFNKDVEELEAFVKALPQGMKVTFIGKARDLFNSGKLDSKRKIDFIQNYFGISLEDNAPLSDIV
jgi:hypothetical protein